MEMQICEKGIIIVLLFAIVSLVVLVIILQVSISLSCTEKIEAIIIDVKANMLLRVFLFRMNRGIQSTVIRTNQRKNLSIRKDIHIYTNQFINISTIIRALPGRHWIF